MERLPLFRKPPFFRRLLLGGLAGLVMLVASGCQSVAYQALEKIGIEKRDILSNRVERARDAQDDAREQFASALDRFRATVEVDGGELEAVYTRLDGEYQTSVRRAEEVSTRIAAVEDVAGDLFAEWEDELAAYSDPALKRRSRVILDQTRERYAQMITAMRRAEQSMTPVLAVFQDQVLFLKHNLNALAIASIRKEMADIERVTQTLIDAMDTSIREADAFIATLDS